MPCPAATGMCSIHPSPRRLALLHYVDEVFARDLRFSEGRPKGSNAVSENHPTASAADDQSRRFDAQPLIFVMVNELL